MILIQNVNPTVLTNLARKPGVFLIAASMATREFTCWCLHILEISNMLILSCPAVSCYLSACFFWSFSSSPAPQLDKTLEWWCKETPSFAYAEENMTRSGLCSTSPGWSFQLSELLELLESVPGEPNACLHANETHMFDMFAWTHWSFSKNKRQRTIHNTRYDMPTLAHGMQCHPVRIWHIDIVKYLYNFRSKKHEKNAMSCSIYNLAQQTLKRAHLNTSWQISNTYTVSWFHHIIHHCCVGAGRCKMDTSSKCWVLDPAWSLSTCTAPARLFLDVSIYSGLLIQYRVNTQKSISLKKDHCVCPAFSSPVDSHWFTKKTVQHLKLNQSSSCMQRSHLTAIKIMKYYPMSIWYYLSLISAVYLCMFRSCLLRLLARPLFFAPAVFRMKLWRDGWSKQILEPTFNDRKQTNVLQGLVWLWNFQQFRHVSTMFDTRNSSNPETSLVTSCYHAPFNHESTESVSVQAFAPQLRHLRVCIAVLMASRIYGTPCPPPPRNPRAMQPWIEP